MLEMPTRTWFVPIESAQRIEIIAILNVSNQDQRARKAYLGVSRYHIRYISNATNYAGGRRYWSSLRRSQSSRQDYAATFVFVAEAHVVEKS